MEDCSIGRSAVVWLQKPNFGSFCCGQPFVSLIVPVNHCKTDLLVQFCFEKGKHSECMQSLVKFRNNPRNSSLPTNIFLYKKLFLHNTCIHTYIHTYIDFISVRIYRVALSVLISLNLYRNKIANTYLIWRTPSPGTWCRITDTSMKGLGPTKKIPIRQVEQEWDLNEIWMRVRSEGGTDNCGISLTHSLDHTGRQRGWVQHNREHCVKELVVNL